MSKKRYTLIDHKWDIQTSYSWIEWELAFVLCFVVGVVTGIIVGIWI